MMNYKKLLISSGCLILAFSLAAQEQPDTLRLSLPDAQTYSLQYNRTVKSSQLDIEIAKKKVQETTAIGLPQFSVTANYQHIFKIPELSFPLRDSLRILLPLPNRYRVFNSSMGPEV